MKETKKDERKTFMVYVEVSPNRYDLDTIKAIDRAEADRKAAALGGWVVE